MPILTDKDFLGVATLTDEDFTTPQVLTDKDFQLEQKAVKPSKPAKTFTQEQEPFYITAHKSLQYGLSNMNAALSRFPAVAYDIAAIPQNLLVKISGHAELQVKSPDWLLNNPIAKFYDKAAQAWQPEELKKDPFQYLKNRDYGGAVKNLTMQVVANAPSQIAIISSTLAGYGVPALVGMGGIQAAQKIKEGTDLQQDPLNVATNAALQGTIEAAFESIGTMGILKQWSKALTKSFGKSTAKQIIKDVGKTIGYSFLGEGNEELWTSFGQDFSDVVTGVNSNAMKGSLGRAMNAFAVGAVSGVAMTAPTAIITGRLSAESNKALKEVSEVIDKVDVEQVKEEVIKEETKIEEAERLGQEEALGIIEAEVAVNWPFEEEFSRRIEQVTTPEELKDIMSELTREVTDTNKDKINRLVALVDKKQGELQTSQPPLNDAQQGSFLNVPVTPIPPMPPEIVEMGSGVTPPKEIREAVSLPATNTLVKLGEVVKYYFGDKEERLGVILGEEKGRKMFEKLRLFDRQINLVKAEIEKRNVAIFKGIPNNARKYMFDVLKGIRRIDGEGNIQFGALQPAGLVPIKSGVHISQVLNDGRIVGEPVDDKNFITYRKYNTAKEYANLVKKYPKAKEAIDKYLALDESIKKTKLNTEIPAFSREILKIQYDIKSFQAEGYSYVPSLKQQQRLLGRLKNILRSYTASGRKLKTGALAESGLEEKDILKAYTVKQQELAYEDLLNDVAGDILSMVLEPIENRQVKPGYVAVNINTPSIEKITKIKKDLFKANGINPDKLSMYQYPRVIEDELKLQKGPKFHTPELQQVYDSLVKISKTLISGITTNYLVRPATAVRNFVSGEIQYSLRVLTHFYEGILGAGLTPVVKDIHALAVAPFVSKEIPAEVLGANFYSDIAAPKSIFGIALKPFQAVEWYFKRASFWADLDIAASKAFNFEIKAGNVTEAMRSKFKEDYRNNYFVDMFQYMSDNAASITFDYWDKPYVLEKLNKGLVPFPNYFYKKWRMYAEYSPLQLRRMNKGNARKKVSKVLAGLTVFSAAWVIASHFFRKREEELDKLALKRIDVRFDTTGRIQVYGDEEVERWLRVYDWPVLGDMLYWREMAHGRADFSDWLKDGLSLGPLLTLPVLAMGFKSKYQTYEPTPAVLGKEIASYIPFGAYIRYARILRNPITRKTASQDYSVFENLVNPLIDIFNPQALPEAVIKIGTEKGKIRKYDIPAETMKLFFLNMKSIDKQEYLNYVHEQVLSGKVRNRMESEARKQKEVTR